MSRQLLVVFGATGNQGGSVVQHILDDADLSSRYSLRAITRNTLSAKAQSLASKDVEVVAADLDDPFTLSAALSKADIVFAQTNTAYENDTRATETRQAMALCEEAIRQGASYIIWSSMSHPSKISNGALTNIVSFDVKAEIEQYIRTLPVKSAFWAPAGFFQNFYSFQAPRPSPANDDTYNLSNVCAGATRVPLLDITDTGAWIAAILADPDKFEGAFIAGAQGIYSQEEIAATLSKVSGKPVKHVHCPMRSLRATYQRPPVMEFMRCMHCFGTMDTMGSTRRKL